jgi:hypothetical protein
MVVFYSQGLSVVLTVYNSDNNDMIMLIHIT